MIYIQPDAQAELRRLDVEIGEMLIQVRSRSFCAGLVVLDGHRGRGGTDPAPPHHGPRWPNLRRSLPAQWLDLGEGAIRLGDRSEMRHHQALRHVVAPELGYLDVEVPALVTLGNKRQHVTLQLRRRTAP